ncbi:hypothetical protein CCH79_00014663 [Gambusia affinis]|uniref:Uncharacterized protein n=1 Tax=Gambusia affinis TaxID=33528 RepID=A0A315V7C7_GAMAF|nr:hypothetical protein CCH79_00014663 [Gambusia affinis]
MMIIRGTQTLLLVLVAWKLFLIRSKLRQLKLHLLHRIMNGRSSGSWRK